MTLTAEEVCEIVRTYLRSGYGAEPEVRLKARTIHDAGLWSVGVFDSKVTGSLMDDLPVPGAAFVVGPDGRLFVLSSNPGIHEYPVCVDLIGRLFRDRVADRVDAQMFAERLQTLTKQRQELERELFRDVDAGVLKRHERWLP